MISYLNFQKFNKEDILNLRNLWNDEFGFIFPMTKELFERNTYLTRGFKENISYVALDNNKPVGFIINKIWETTNVDGIYENIGWISLIFVSKKYRKLGIGSKLLELTESNFRKLGITEINLGKDYQNFFPGLPKDLKQYLDWFKKRGFEDLYETNDLINNRLQKFNLKQKPNNDLEVRTATKDDFKELINFMEKNFPGRWLVELKDYIKNEGTGKEFIICLTKDKKIVGFCKACSYNTLINQISFSLTWRERFIRLGGIGPLGVDANFRKQHIAYNLIVKAIEELKNANCEEAIIDWTNLLEFYRKFDFEIWKTYIYIKKNLN